MRIYDTSSLDLDAPDVAIVGMAARLPGALDVFEFWNNLEAGIESVRDLSDEDLRKAGVERAVLQDPNYVKRAALLDKLELFDADFFGFSRREAGVLDPQHRHFLEVCFEALESAGIVPEAFGGAIGVFAGSGMNSYLPYNLFTNPELMRSLGLFLARHTGNDKDFLTTRASYCLNLTGPSLNVQTACSTSLVAIHLACQSLLASECDAALAGGVTIELPHYRGYRYEEGEILSPDGSCRPFEARSKGTLFGSGAGVVVLKRLRDAIAAGDHIHALIKGTAINNDGDRKVGYLAPSVPGQAECVVEALEVAGLSARDVSYVECHGTGTPVGDPIEIAALTQAFARSTSDRGFCGVGSVKSNIGHLDTAAGVASLIKVAQMLEHETLAPTLHFERPNPQIDFPSTPFFVVHEKRAWPRNATPRRAGVSSLGVGGTNAHVVLEEAPARLPRERVARPTLLLLSARSRSSLDVASRRLARHLREHPDTDLELASATLLRGRRRFAFSRVLAGVSATDFVGQLENPDAARTFDVATGEGKKPIVFLFPGGGAQHVNMARRVYDAEPAFKAALDECLDSVRRHFDLSLHALIFPQPGDEERAAKELERPSRALPALLAVEIAFAKLLIGFGLEPAAMLGHSLGEYAAAHLAGVLGLEAALGVVYCRGRLFETVRPGGMLSVPMAPEALEPLLGSGLSIAAVNAPEMSVVSGDHSNLEQLERALLAREVTARRLHIDVPAHSPLLDPILGEFRAYLESMELRAPQRAYISNLTGAFVTPQDLSAEYFVRHLRSTVRFSDGLATALAAHPEAILVEVGPGQTLSSLARLHPARRSDNGVVPLSPHVKETLDGAAYLRSSIGRILAHGGAVDLDALGIARGVAPLPPTPFEHERHWIEPGRGYFMSDAEGAEAAREDDVARWFWRPSFREEPRGAPGVTPGELWWIFADRELGHSLQLEARARGAHPILIVPDVRSERVDATESTLKLSEAEDFDRILQALVLERGAPRRILHALALGGSARAQQAEVEEELLDRLFYSLLHIAQALSHEELGARVDFSVAVSNAYDVTGAETRRPLHALTQGPVLVIPREVPELKARAHDIGELSDREVIARALADELATETNRSLVAERGGLRFVDTLERLSLDTHAPLALPERPVVLLTGGLGGIARTLARHFAEARGARLVLVSRSSFPATETWRAARERAEAGSLLAEQLDDLLALQDAGVEVMLERADVTSREQVAGLLERVRERYGGPDVVVHAAGALDDAPLALKDRARARAVLAPKLDATLNLLDALARTPPAFLLLLSSTSAMLGPPGQIDYTSANAVVAALARYARSRLPRTRVTSLGFGIWRDTGMAARALRPAAPTARGEPTGHPLIQRLERRANGELLFESSFDPARLWLLDEHRVRGRRPVLPGTGIVEIVRAAGSSALGLDANAPVALTDVLFLSPCEVPDREPRLARVMVSSDPAEPGSARVLLTSRGRGESTDTEHARGSLRLLEGPPPEPLRVTEIFTRCNARSMTFEPGRQVLPQDRHLAFGPRFRVLESASFGEREAVASLALPAEYASDLDALQLHPALLDIASGFAFSLADAALEGDRVRVPLSYQRLLLHAPLERRLVSHVRLRSVTEDGIAVFDVTIADPEGRVLAEIEGYTTKAVSPESLSRAPQAAREAGLLERWAGQGITRPEGVEVVERLLSHATPAELYASPTSLYELVAELSAAPGGDRHPEAPGPASVRPSSASTEAPRDDVERRLAEMWRTLLGVENVGIRDNFFDLGGHSLIAVRLFARIKKAYGVDLPLAVLFQAPTIESCAEILRGQLGITFKPDVAPPEQGSAPRRARVERSFEHVVTIQQGSSTIPFFCVHGAGGNVLNFRDLARHLGSEQTFIGVQARGVNGEPPAQSIEEMASLYSREIREAYPQGPYYLGGYSGGGVVAYELAQRLRGEGAEVPLLVFLDTFHPHTSPRKLTLRERMDKLIEEGPSYLSKRGKSRLIRQMGELSVELKIRLLESNRLPLPLELREIQLTRAFVSAARRYQPRRYEGRVILFRARMMAEIYRHVGPMLGWQGLVPNLEVVEVPGGHDSLVLEPNVQVLASHLTRALTSDPSAERPEAATPTTHRKAEK